MTAFEGPIVARKAVADYLASPAALAVRRRYRRIWQVDETQLPDPVMVLEREATELEQFPLIAVTTGPGTRRMTRLEHEDGVSTYSSTYPIRVYVWARDEGREAVGDQRDRLASWVIAALLDDVTCGRPDVQIREETITTSPSDTTPVNGERFVAGAWVGVDVTVEETLTRDPLGVVRTATGEVTVYSPS